MRNLKLTIQYDGNKYCGWQKQPNSPGIQGTIEYAIYEITKEKVNITGSGRTDAGVHALKQIVLYHHLEFLMPLMQNCQRIYL